MESKLVPSKERLSSSSLPRLLPFFLPSSLLIFPIPLLLSYLFSPLCSFSFAVPSYISLYSCSLPTLLIFYSPPFLTLLFSIFSPVLWTLFTPFFFISLLFLFLSPFFPPFSLPFIIQRSGGKGHEFGHPLIPCFRDRNSFLTPF